MLGPPLAVGYRATECWPPTAECQWKLTSLGSQTQVLVRHVGKVSRLGVTHGVGTVADRRAHVPFKWVATIQATVIVR